MAEAPGSRTQPPRAGGERPILKTGRATGPRSLPDRAWREERGLVFDQTNVAGPRAFLRFLGGEIDALTLTQKLEYSAANRTTMEEMLDSALVADETEPFVDKKPRDSAGWHTFLREQSDSAH